MQTWTLVRFLHILAMVFFVGGQLIARRVGRTGNPETRRRADDADHRAPLRQRQRRAARPRVVRAHCMLAVKQVQLFAPEHRSG
jgi:uncharacterized membrane protein